MSYAGPVGPAEMLRRDMPDVPGLAKFGFLKPIVRGDLLRRGGIRYAEGVHAGEDFPLYFECAAEGARFHLTPEAYYVYQRRVGSASQRASAALDYSEANRRLRGIAARLGDRALDAALRRRQRALDYSSFEHAVERGRALQALRHAHPGSRDRLLTHLRLVARALRRLRANRARLPAP